MRARRQRQWGIPLMVVWCCFLLMLGSFQLSSAQTTAPTTSETAVKPPTGTPGEETSATEKPVAGEAAPDEEAAKRLSLVKSRVTKDLEGAVFTYDPTDMTDPFIAYIVPIERRGLEAKAETAGEDEVEPELPPEPPRPLTPLQRMNLTEVERGLKAILVGQMGRKAIIEDASGKGFIVSVGTPLGEKNGVIAEIFEDHLIVQQEIWDRFSKQMITQNVIVKMTKPEEKK